jgi:predicted deacylase
MKIHHITGFLLMIIVAVMCFATARSFLSMHRMEAVYPSRFLTIQKKLSAYFPGLKDSPGDTDVFVFESQTPGGTLLILGGTHPNEPAGCITAILLVENLGVSRGKVIIIPRSNNSGFTHSDPQEGNPQRFSFETPGGKRWFRYGSRLTNPIHQWPDPVLYVNPAGQKLSGTESRNLNRCYPGRKKGFLTEKIAYGIMALIRKEKVDLGVDLHEAAPEYPVINAIVFHENSAELSALALLKLQIEGFEIRLEASPPNLRGLSHREWGDSAQIMAILLETANASHGRLKGKSTTSLILDGKDKNYVKAAKLGRLFVPFDEKGVPLRQRVSRHLAALKVLVTSLEELHPELCVELENIPSAAEVQKAGIGAFLKGQK